MVFLNKTDTFIGFMPPNILLETTGPEKQFSYNEIITAIADVYDPSSWLLTYNRKTGEMVEVEEWPDN